MEGQLDIIQKAITRDNDAFIRITRDVTDKLYHTAYVILYSEADACDAVDETLYNAWRNIHRLRHPEFFHTWITRILINQCNKIRKRRKREVTVESLGELRCEDFDTLPIRDAVAKLPEELRIVISLRYFSDLTVPETASMLSIPPGTVKSRQRKALSLLRIEWEDIHESKR